jgi:hypothetical protein
MLLLYTITGIDNLLAIYYILLLLVLLLVLLGIDNLLGITDYLLFSK